MSAFIVDLDGTLLDGDVSYKGAEELIAYLQAHEASFLIMTNSIQSQEAIVKRLAKNNIDIDEGHILNPIVAINQWMSANNLQRPFIIGSEAECKQVSYDHFEKDMDCILLLDFENILADYSLINQMMCLIRSGIPAYTASKSTFYIKNGHYKVDTGAYVTMLEQASEREITVLGKPSKQYFEMGCAILNLRAEEVTIIGDDIHTDMKGADTIGARGFLVKTGKYKVGDEHIFKGISCFESLDEILADIRS